MTDQDILKDIDRILNLDSTTWQEKKNLLADYVEQWRMCLVIRLMDDIRSKKITSAMTNEEILKSLEQ